MLKPTRVDPTAGAIAPAVARYAFPIFLTTMIQTLMNAADAAVIGNLGTSTDVASVGATTFIVALLVTSMCGIADGAKIILARAIGNRDFERCKKIINNALAIALGVGFIMSLAGSLSARKILESMNCPSDCIDGAATYLAIYFASTPLTLIYNFGAGIIAVSGDSVKPMRYMIISGVSNVILNIILCLILPNKVAAVAIATVAGTGISTALVIRDLIRHDKFPFRLREFKLDIHECILIFKFGIPIAFNSALYSIANLQIQSALNAYGSSAIAGSVAANYIESLLTCTTTAMNSSVLTFAGQNLGAKEPKRVEKSIIVCTTASFVICTVGWIILLSLGKYELSIFVPGDDEAIKFGLIRLAHIIPFYSLSSINGCLASAIQAFGYTYIPSTNSIVSVLLFRVAWMTFIYSKFTTPYMLFACYSVSWMLSWLVCVIAFAVIYSKFKKGKLTKI